MSKLISLLFVLFTLDGITSANEYKYGCLNPEQYKGDNTQVNPAEFGSPGNKSCSVWYQTFQVANQPLHGITFSATTKCTDFTHANGPAYLNTLAKNCCSD